MNHRKDKDFLSEVEVGKFADICVDDTQACGNQNLENLTIAFSAPVGQAFQQVDERGRLNLKSMPKTEDDKALIAKVRARLISPQRLKIFLNEL